MGSEAANTAALAGPPASGCPVQEIVHPMQLAILVVSDGVCDASKLAKHLAESGRATASVALLSIEQVGSVIRSSGTTIDYASTSAGIWKLLEHRDCTQGVPSACADVSSGFYRPPQCVQICNLPAAQTAKMSERCDPELATSSSNPDAFTAEFLGVGGQAAQRHSSNLITLMIASGRDAVCKGLLARLANEQGIRVLGEPIADPALLMMGLQRHRPKLLLLDEALLGLPGSRALRMIRRKFPKLRVLLLSDQLGDALAEEILRNRFDGLLLARCPDEAYIKAMRAVARGELWLPRALLAKVVADRLRATDDEDRMSENEIPHDDAKAILTRRERQIVVHLRQGLTNKEIGRRLGIMEDTVKKHLKNVFGKLGVRRRTLVVLHHVSGQPNPDRRFAQSSPSVE